MLVIALAAFLILGCSEDEPYQRAAIRGEVTFDGEPLEAGTIRFVPLPGTRGPTAFGLIQDGTFAIPEESGPGVGEYSVEMTSLRKTGRTVAGSDGKTNDEEEQFLPACYNVDSTLRVTIAPGENTGSFELKTKTRR